MPTVSAVWWRKRLSRLGGTSGFCDPGSANLPRFGELSGFHGSGGAGPKPNIAYAFTIRRRKWFRNPAVQLFHAPVTQPAALLLCVCYAVVRPFAVPDLVPVAASGCACCAVVKGSGAQQRKANCGTGNTKRSIKRGPVCSTLSQTHVYSSSATTEATK